MGPSRLLRAVLMLTTLAVVWLVASPARASELTAQASFAASFSPVPVPSPAPAAPIGATTRAPLCDPRGAITFAPPPQMQDVEASLDTGLTLDDCFTSSSSGAFRRAAPGRAPLPLDAQGASTDAAVLASAVTLVASARELLPAPAASTACPRPGFRSTVDRPPRA